MFEYRVNWYNEFDGKEVYARGIVSGGSYTEAAQKVIHDYGESNIINLFLEAMEDTEVIELKTIKEHFGLN